MKKILLAICLIITCVCVVAQDLYRARPDGNVDSVFLGIDLPDAYKGDSVIIGVTDWGFDYTHPTFYDTSMTRYRVLRAWDQFRTAGPAPEGFDYGTELIGQDQLLAVQCDTSNIYGHHYHGTHVAGIAAGSGAGTIYRGVAPNAELLFCSFRPDEQSAIDAFQWMYDVAQQEHKRLVINMSWGIYWMDNLVGTGIVGQKMQELSDLGVVFVTSGGNNGDVNFHLGHTFNNDTIRSRFYFPADYGSSDYWGSSISMTNSPGQPFSFCLTVRNSSLDILVASPFFNTASCDSHIENYFVLEGDTIPYIVDVIASNEAGRPQARLRVKKVTKSGWRFCLTVAGASGDFHAWNLAELTTGVGNWGGRFQGYVPETWIHGNPSYGCGAPAIVSCAITVAAHQSRYAISDTTYAGGAICSFSSIGPTIDGRDKPDISAPGYEVCSSLSSYADESLTAVQTVEYNGRTYKFGKLSGTSMSSPFTTGVVALLLQANPTLTPEEVKRCLIFTATHDEFTEASGMTRFGHGKVNAYQAILGALYHAGTQEFVSESNQFTIFPNPASDVIFISTPNSTGKAEATLYDLNGRLLQRNILHQGVTQLDLNSCPNGCYILRITNGDFVQTEKIIKAK